VTDHLERELFAAGSALAAVALVSCGAAFRWLRMRDDSSTAPSALELCGRIATMGGISVVAATLARMAVGLLAGAEGSAMGWEWLIRIESVAVAASVLLILFVDSSSGRFPILMGAGLAAASVWGLGESLAFLQGSVELDRLGAPLMAATLCALLLSPSPTGRLIRRVRAAAAAESSDEFHLVVDEAGALLYASDGARDALRLPARSRRLFARPETVPDALLQVVKSSSRKKSRLRTPAGRVFEAEPTALMHFTLWRRARGIVVHDVSSEYRDQRRLVQLAHYDSLTGLANRRLFLETLSKLLDKASANSHHVALFYIDLDDFKAVNDSYGHAAGDELLVSMSKRLSDRLKPDEVSTFGVPREAKLLVARLAGDEFAVIASQVPDGSAAADLAGAILETARRSIQLGDRTVNPSASVGIALYPDDGEDVDTLLHRADSALYIAKSRGKQRFARYEISHEARAERARALEEGLRQALQRDEMRLHYQPKVDTQSGQLVGFEALLRWRSVELGDVGPAEFIPIAEQRGLITTLGTWCLDAACHQLRAWQDAGFEPVPVAVNVSSLQFAESDLQRVVSEALQRHGLEPRQLALELTESLLLEEGPHVESVLRDLRSIGIKISLDDFGTGYSALTYLNRFQLDELKMDRGLLRDIDSNPSALGVASAVVSMAHSLGLTVVAEGIDMPEQLGILREMGCDHIQGFLFAPALPAHDVERYMKRPGEEGLAFEPGMVVPGRRPAKVEVAKDEDEDSPILKDAARRPAPGSRQAPPRPRGSVLVVDDGQGTLGEVSLRFGRLGIDIHYASEADEARLLVEQEKSAIRLLVVPPNADFERIGQVRELLTELTGEERRLVVIGERPDDETRDRIRESGVSWVLWAPYNDGEIRYVIKSAMALRRDLIDRREIRVPVDIVANIWSGPRREVTVVSSLSPRGAFIELSEPLPSGSSLRIEMELPGNRFRGFARVAYERHDDPDQPATPSGVGVTFYGVDRDAERILRKAISELEARYLP
jgi:diguanylate cyclase (GGDEF)-like protein